MTLHTPKLKLYDEVQRETTDMAHAQFTYVQYTNKNISCKNIRVGLRYLLSPTHSSSKDKVSI